LLLIKIGLKTGITQRHNLSCRVAANVCETAYAIHGKVHL